MAASIAGTEQDPNHIALVMTDGTRVDVLKDDVFNFYSNSVADDRQADTTMWIKQQLVTFAGVENINPNRIIVEWSTEDGSFSEFTRLSYG